VGAPGEAGVSILIDKAELMFLGQFYHNLDNKGRLTIPARFREFLSADGAYVMLGFDQNLMVLPSPTFQNLSHRIKQMSMTNPNSRILRRLIFSTANYVEIDKVGRVLIPQYLQKSASIDGSAVVIGSGDFFEIWSPDLWTAQVDQLHDAELNAHRFEALDLTSI
jgi:MraZ protein